MTPSLTSHQPSGCARVSPGSYGIDHKSNRHDDLAIVVAMAAAHLIAR
jgi:hypothetical protein